MRMAAVAVLLAFLLFTPPAESQRRWLNGAALQPLSASSQLRISGNNLSEREQVVVIRIDDSPSPSYAERVNLERVVPPGPFQLTVPLGGLQKPSRQPLSLEKIRQIIVFAGGDEPNLLIDPPQLMQRQPLPADAVGWDLGPAGSALWPGFNRLDPNYSGLHGSQLRGIDRSARQPANEGLTTDGIRGIESLALPLPAGQWQVTLWIDDRGEWEYLPHPLERRIEANGHLIFEQSLTPQQWIEQHYLAGLTEEFQPGESAWQRYGLQPRGRISFIALVGAEGLQLRFSGQQPEAGYLAAVLAEPAPGGQAAAAVEQALQQWWNDNWPVLPPSTAPPTALQLHSETAQRTIARGTSGTLELQLLVPRSIPVTGLRLEPFTYNSYSLPTVLRWGRWQLRRTRLSSTLLQPTDSHLRSTLRLPPSNGLPRRLHLEIRVPEQAPPGRYQGRVNLQVGGITLTQALQVDVPDVTLPAADRPVGVYLERPPQLTWFSQLADARAAALHCDLDYLGSIGLSGLSPGLTTPASPAAQQALVSELQAVQRAGFRTPLAYAPFKRLQQALGPERAAVAVKAVEDSLLRRGIRPPLWSIADEPSNPGEGQELLTIVRYLRAFAPDARLAAHLNAPQDARYLPALDVALINAGFGVDQADLQRVRATGARPWFYNMEQPRHAAGFYLWISGAEGYLQWHARMPTAAPFDPTDGREDDVQWLYPSATPCPPQLDVDRRLFTLVEGLTDLRWLLWLEQRAQHDTQAGALLHQLRKQVPHEWAAMQQITSQQLDTWRASIIALTPSTSRD